MIYTTDAVSERVRAFAAVALEAIDLLGGVRKGGPDTWGVLVVEGACFWLGRDLARNCNVKVEAFSMKKSYGGPAASALLVPRESLLPVLCSHGIARPLHRAEEYIADLERDFAAPREGSPLAVPCVLCPSEGSPLATWVDWERFRLGGGL